MIGIDVRPSFWPESCSKTLTSKNHRYLCLPKSDGVEIKGEVGKPLYPPHLPNLLQIREFLPATRTRSFWLHLDQPISNTFAMKGMNAFWIGRPDNHVSFFVNVEANGTTIWNRLPIPKFELSVFLLQRQGATGISAHFNVIPTVWFVSTTVLDTRAGFNHSFTARGRSY